jgi:hypothetical protein
MGKLFTCYIATCEILGGVMFLVGACFTGLAAFKDANYRINFSIVTLVLIALAVLMVITAKGLYNGGRKAWIASWFIGLMMAALAAYSLLDWAMDTHHNSRGEGYDVIAAAILAFLTLLGFVFLSLPVTRRYVTRDGWT